MSERDPSLSTAEADMAPALAIGGVMTVKQLLFMYEPLLGQHPIPARDRFFPIPRHLVKNREALESKLETDIEQACDKLDERAVLIGHSLGGHVAVRFGLEHPDKVAAVVSLAGAQMGVKQETPSIRGLTRILGSPQGRIDMQHDSTYMTEHLDRVASEWSPEVDLHLIAATIDDMFPGGHSLGVQLPEGQEVHRRVVGWPGSTFMNRLLFSGMPAGTKAIHSILPTSHYDIPRNPSVINYVRGVRLVAKYSETLTPDTPDFDNVPSLIPVAA